MRSGSALGGNFGSHSRHPFERNEMLALFLQMRCLEWRFRYPNPVWRSCVAGSCINKCVRCVSKCRCRKAAAQRTELISVCGRQKEERLLFF